MLSDIESSEKKDSYFFQNFEIKIDVNGYNHACIPLNHEKITKDTNLLNNSIIIKN